MFSLVLLATFLKVCDVEKVEEDLQIIKQKYIKWAQA